MNNEKTAPESQEDVCIDGMDVDLPAGSVIFAVVNENGTLVSVPTMSQSLEEDVQASSVQNIKSSMCTSPISNSILAHTDNSLSFESFLDIKPQVNVDFSNMSGTPYKNKEIGESLPALIQKEITCIDERATESSSLDQNHESMMPLYVKMETPTPVELKEELIDIETFSEETPGKLFG